MTGGSAASLPHADASLLDQPVQCSTSRRMRANWRIVFRFADGKAFDVDLVDYH
jgi:plasmid maintenance system killer protein